MIVVMVMMVIFLRFLWRLQVFEGFVEGGGGLGDG